MVVLLSCHGSLLAQVQNPAPHTLPLLLATATIWAIVPRFEELGERLFEEELATLIYPESRALGETHLELGHTVAIISSATRYQIDPLARDLGVEVVVCSELEVEDGRFTGRVLFACDGRRKAEGAERLSLEHGVDLDESYFYTDSYQDLPLLQLVGKPRPVNPDANLARVARRRAWPT